MEITEKLYVTDRKSWRVWLKANYKSKKEIWLIYYHKNSGKPRIPYNDAVEEALCFGWIDSIVKKHDAESSAQRFSPRNPRSGYSEPNKERLRKLIRQGKVVKEVRDAVAGILDEEWEMPEDILNEIKSNAEAWKHFQRFPESYRRIRVAYVDGARKRPEEFRKRLDNFIRKTAKNRKFGYVDIEDITSG